MKDEVEKEYYKKIIFFLQSKKKEGKIIYPEDKNIFQALNLTPFQNIKVVIIGQDPYHKKGQAHGLSFSVQEGVKVPPSLKNIYKEINNNFKNTTTDINNSSSGNLNYLSQQGVLLLNAILTVEEGKPASHSKIGWGTFTDSIIKKISNEKENVVFLLWGAFAKSKNKIIDSNKHLVLETSHPSPLGSYRGFLGSKCFLETNVYLEKHGNKKISWKKEQ